MFILPLSPTLPRRAFRPVWNGTPYRHVDDGAGGVPQHGTAGHHRDDRRELRDAPRHGQDARA